MIRGETVGTQRAVVTVAAMLGMFLAAIDQTAVGTAMPSITRALGGLGLYSWVFAAYQLAFVTTTPIFGRLADIYGQKLIYLTGILWFVGASVLCGFSQSMGELVAFRLLQGIGGGAVPPIAFTIVADLFPVTERLRIQGIFSGVFGLASIVGPLLGGFLTDHFSWRWIFFLNVPAGLVATAIITTGFADASARRSGRIDFAGITLLTAASVVLLLLLLWGGHAFPWRSPQTAGLLILCVSLVCLFVHIEVRTSSPFLPLGVFRTRLVTVGSVGNFLLGASMFGAVVYVPLFVQGVFGKSATAAGAILVPFSLCWTLGSITGGQLSLRWGYRPVMTNGMILMVIGFAFLSRLTPEAALRDMVLPMVVLGIGMGLTASMFMIAMQNAVASEFRGIVTSVNVFSRNIGSAIGVSLQGAVLIAVLAHQLETHVAASTIRKMKFLSPHDSLGVSLQAGLGPTGQEVFRQALSQAIHSTFLFGLALVALGLIIVLLFVPAGSVVELAQPETSQGAEAD
jgi:EmrB/QacA subfamily drug resistance transporter